MPYDEGTGVQATCDVTPRARHSCNLNRFHHNPKTILVYISSFLSIPRTHAVGIIAPTESRMLPHACDAVVMSQSISPSNPVGPVF